MNPGLVVKLRPAGPWRIGPDSGARNRVDVVYHSDSLYAAVTGALARLGWLEEWLGATARQDSPAVCFSSCFPFLDEIGFVIPPRTIWPPTSPALLSARVRWKSARFVPLGIVQALLAGQTLDGNHWSVDGPSECLVPAGRPGPFRTGVRFNAAVDRLTGAAERHSTACIEFRAGSGLWAIVSFRDDAARARWSDPVKAAFRLLADSGFGGERSRGWGRSETPEFIEGTMPEMILPRTEAPAPVPEPEAIGPLAASVESRPELAPLAMTPGPGEPVETNLEAAVKAAPPSKSSQVHDEKPTEAGPVPALETGAESAAPEPSTEAQPPAEPASEAPTLRGNGEPPSAPEIQPVEPATPAELVSAEPSPEDAAEPESAPTGAVTPPADEQPSPVAAAEPSAGSGGVSAEAAPPAEPGIEQPSPAAAAGPSAGPEVPPAEIARPANESPDETPLESDAQARPEPPSPTPVSESPAPGARPPVPGHWLLSLFTPATSDAIDWHRGNYTILARGGRIDSPTGSGELKKQLNMVAEGSVLLAASAPCGSAPDVAPEGFAHPVFRAGFALSIPLPPHHEVS